MILNLYSSHSSVENKSISVYSSIISVKTHYKIYEILKLLPVTLGLSSLALPVLSFFPGFEPFVRECSRKTRIKINITYVARCFKLFLT